jgi:hypothetical protein
MELVTSQRGVVETVDPADAAVVVRVDDGRLVRLTGEQTGADRLGYSYATTVHRAQAPPRIPPTSSLMEEGESWRMWR